MKITNLRKDFETFSLLIDNLTIPKNQICGLIGPNGSGKTTAIKIMAGLLKPDSGVIDYEGLGPRDITMVPRKPYFLHDTVLKNLTYPLTLRKIKPDPALVDYFLELSGLQDCRKQYAPALSAGQQQKLSLVRALIFSPRLILIDEAFSNLDIESTAVFERLILTRQQEAPATWVVISHQLPHIQRLCGHTYFMQGGSVETGGPTGEILFRSQVPSLQKYLRHERLEHPEGK